MEVTERDRQQLFAWFEEHMGEERASTMMELMPPAGASQLATKKDLDALEARLGARLDVTTENLRSDLQRTLGTWIFASQAAVIAAIGLFTSIG